MEGRLEGVRSSGRRGYPGVEAEEIRLLQSLSLGPAAEVWSGVTIGRLRFKEHAETDERFEVSGRDWLDIRLDLGGRRMLEGGRLAGAWLSAGSSSDKPFDSSDELMLSVLGFFVAPHRPGGSWVYLLHYGNRRTFLPDVPLPGLAYWYVPSADTQVLIGVPAAAARLRRGPVQMQGAVFGPVAASLEAGWLGTGPVIPYLRLEIEERSWARARRARRGDELVFREVTASAGLRRRLGRGLRLDASIGFAADRRLYESRGFGERREGRLRLGEAVLARITVTAAGPSAPPSAGR